MEGLITIAGGKGGAGKSAFALHLAKHFADQGRTVILVDADFTGGGLHNFFGLSRRNPGLTQLLVNPAISLSDITIETHVDRLFLIPTTDTLSYFTPMSYGRLKSTFKKIMAMPHDLLIVDLGAGNAPATMDLSLLSTRPLVVTNPDPVSYSRTFAFFRSIVFRLVKKALSGDKDRLKEVRTIVKEGGESGRRRPGPFLEQLRQSIMNDEQKQLFGGYCAAFTPQLIVNRTGTKLNTEKLKKAVQTFNSIYPIEVEPMARLPEDPLMAEATQETRILEQGDGSRFHTAVGQVHDKLMAQLPQCSLEHGYKF